MRGRLLLAFLGFTLFLLFILELPLGTTYARDQRGGFVVTLERDAAVLGSFSEDVDAGSPARLTAAIDRYARRDGAHVVVYDATGRMMAAVPSTDAADLQMLRRAMTAGVATQGDPVRPHHQEVAVRLVTGGVVLISSPTGTIDHRIARNWLRLGLIAIGAVVLASLAGAQLAHTATRPIEALQHAAMQLGAGDLSTRAPEDAAVPELRELAHAFNEMSARLQELLDSHRSFVADASHQLRTPLTALRLRLENLETVLPAEQHRELDGALREAQRLARIVDGLLAIARTEGARPERARTDAVAVISERTGAWSAFAEERNVTLDAGDGAPLHVLAVPGHLEQILDNLLANALDAAPDGSSVEIHALAGERLAEIHVVDHGSGLTGDDRTHAFDRFWRKRTGPGSGLGLAIVRQLATANGGNAELRAAHGGGIDAVVRLPLAED